MAKAPETLFHIEQFVPGLQAALGKEPLNLERTLRVAAAVRNPDERPLVPMPIQRGSINLSDGTDFCAWEIAPTLSALFRGDRQPPVLGDYPSAYEDSFALFDLHALEVSGFFGDRRDEEMLEIYSALRRRPDGRSLGFVHDYMWQTSALILGTRILSQLEFEAIVARLERSCRTFRQGPTSRNYITSLRQILRPKG